MRRKNTWILRSVRAMILLAAPAFAFELFAQETPAQSADVSPTVASEKTQPTETEGEKLPSWVDDKPTKIDLSKVPMEEVCVDPELVASSCGSGKRIVFKADFQSVFFIKNDEDFDDTPPEYNEDSQQSAFLGTYLRPEFSFYATDNLKIFWEFEIGLNLWSRNNADQNATGSGDYFLFKQRELNAQGSFMDGLVGFSVGYQHFSDPTGLFLNHWIGAASFISKPESGVFTLSMAQIPDNTAEGILTDENSLTRDRYVFGFRADMPFKSGETKLVFSPAVYHLYDDTVVDYSKNLANLSLHLDLEWRYLTFIADLAWQYGITSNGAYDGGDVIHSGYAAQIHLGLDFDPFLLDFNFVNLSGDDDHEANDSDGAFLYSGKNRSKTILLSEDEIRDRGDNLDERMGSSDGGFTQIRAGYQLVDLNVAMNVTDYFQPALVVGAAVVNNDTNAMRASFVGMETNLNLKFMVDDVLDFHLVGAILVPGKAASARINGYDRSKTNLMYAGEVAMGVHF